MSEINPPELESPTPLAAILGCGLKILASIAGGLLAWWLLPLYWGAAQAITSALPYSFLLPAILGFWGLCVLGTMHHSKEFRFLYKTWGASAIMIINATVLFIAYLMTIKNWNGILWGSCWIELGIAGFLVGHIGLLAMEYFELDERVMKAAEEKKNAQEAANLQLTTEQVHEK
ncbi:hypothetical protein RYA05_03325 [Pseudomonas syringae pv. actinidiae]|nr:hypothetical protein [Pseudomonas syringae pv. actinidiae]